MEGCARRPRRSRREGSSTTIVGRVVADIVSYVVSSFEYMLVGRAGGLILYMTDIMLRYTGGRYILGGELEAAAGEGDRLIYITLYNEYIL